MDLTDNSHQARAVECPHQVRAVEIESLSQNLRVPYSFLSSLQVFYHVTPSMRRKYRTISIEASKTLQNFAPILSFAQIEEIIRQNK